MADAWMVYGAYGYTGRLVLERAVAAGYKPVVAGRDPDRTESLALEFGLPHRSFELSDTEALRRGLNGRYDGACQGKSPYIHPNLLRCGYFQRVTGNSDGLITRQRLVIPYNCHRFGPLRRKPLPQFVPDGNEVGGTGDHAFLQPEQKTVDRGADLGANLLRVTFVGVINPGDTVASGIPITSGGCV